MSLKNLTKSFAGRARVARVAQILVANAPAYAELDGGIILRARYATTRPEDLVAFYRRVRAEQGYADPTRVDPLRLVEVPARHPGYDHYRETIIENAHAKPVRQSEGRA